MLGFIFILGGAAIFMVLERLFPYKKLSAVPGWWKRAVLINSFQLCSSIIGMYSWEKWVQRPSIINLNQYVGPITGGFIAYIINTWIFYWWHLLRHEDYFCWRIFHQVHHSPTRIELMTAFYKHPLEIIADSIIIAILIYPILGLTPESSIWVSIFSAAGEFFYHVNLKTPEQVGPFFQRPESHHEHHFQNKRTNCHNFADLPLWDILNGTYYNPKREESDKIPTGFPKAETKLTDMLLFQDVLHPERNRDPWKQYRKPHTIFGLLLLILGCLQPIGFILNIPELKGIGMVSVASPLPLVFSSYQGVETFSTTFSLVITDRKNQTINMPLTTDIYSQIKGPYNLRNAYGVTFSHGPFFNTPELIKLRDQVFNYGLCQGGLTLNLGKNMTSKDIKEVEVIIRSNTIGQQHKKWILKITCHNPS